MFRIPLCTFLILVFAGKVSSATALSQGSDDSLVTVDLVQELKDKLSNGKQILIDPISSNGVTNPIPTNPSGWLLSSVYSGSSCGSSGMKIVQGYRTDCLKASDKSSIRVSCNATTVIMDSYFYSGSCGGRPTSRSIAPINTCQSSQFSTDSYSFSCVTSNLLLPPGDWFTYISYGDATCNQKDMFYGWKNGVCIAASDSTSMLYSYPTLYSYSASSTCTGTATTGDLSSMTQMCYKKKASTSVRYLNLHSDGTPSPSASPTYQPTLNPTTAPKPTKSSTSKPTTKGSTAKPTARKPTAKPTSLKPTRKPTAKKGLIIDDPSDGSSSTVSENGSNSSHHSTTTKRTVIVTVCVLVSVLVLVLGGLGVWLYMRRGRGFWWMGGLGSKYVELSVKEERGGGEGEWEGIEEIPEAL